MRTNIVLNDELIKEAIQLTGVSTKREAGEIDLFDGYDYKASRELRHGTD